MLPSFPYASLTSLTIFVHLQPLLLLVQLLNPESLRFFYLTQHLYLLSVQLVVKLNLLLYSFNDTFCDNITFHNATENVYKIPLTFSSPKMILNASVTFFSSSASRLHLRNCWVSTEMINRIHCLPWLNLHH